jgi:hypothetical protein
MRNDATTNSLDHVPTCVLISLTMTLRRINRNRPRRPARGNCTAVPLPLPRDGQHWPALGAGGAMMIAGRARLVGFQQVSDGQQLVATQETRTHQQGSTDRIRIFPARSGGDRVIGDQRQRSA